MYYYIGFGFHGDILDSLLIPLTGHISYWIVIRVSLYLYLTLSSSFHHNLHSDSDYWW